MSDAQQVDLVVIGLGPGGEALATATAKAGLRVVAVDKRLVGGECPYFGCVPTKMMVRASDVLAEAGRAAELAGEVTVRSSWAPVAERVAVPGHRPLGRPGRRRAARERRCDRAARRGPAGRRPPRRRDADRRLASR